MEKRLTRTEMLFSLGFLFMLVFSVGAFFYGVKVGSDRTEANFVQNTKHLSSSNKGVAAAYQQQDLVSFYHTVFLPYREFQNEWIDVIRKLPSGQLDDIGSSLKELSGLAKKTYDETQHSTVSKSSPLLESAQLQLLKSLRMFTEAAQRGAGSSKDMKSNELYKALMKDAYYADGVKFALGGQKDYYAAMLKWSASVNPNIPEDYEKSTDVSIAQWKLLKLTVKNKVAADQLNARKTLASFYPQDLTSRVDEFIGSGQAASMKMRTVDSVIDLLVKTEAVRAGDFSTSKDELYSKELLPQLPFFYPVNE
ncbi:hypothetical protein GZH47_04750 [Paenibacillus rhizovicinus]|uniref:Uncharacterized protein n=1 Tax=Paenibacillus rhizovicinus TaxID=2704463 RepID=A0A6C0NVN6_9BACL|nr:hypothetical protein [Paenibacillus rhizovicinus]QHW30218.1 hypothetical protein GZH47_04750 [Paenibacillus rhizovicinus]